MCVSRGSGAAKRPHQYEAAPQGVPLQLLARILIRAKRKKGTRWVPFLLLLPLVAVGFDALAVLVL